MKKPLKAISLILFTTVFATLLLPGCKRQEDRDNAKYEISKTGMSSWDVTIGRKGKVKVNCFLFPRSAGLEKEYQSKMSMEKESMSWAEEQKEKAPIPEIRKSYEEELQLRKEGRWPWPLVDSWPDCNIVVVFPVMTEKVRKVTIVCRPDFKSLDIVLNMQSKQDHTFLEFLQIAREIVQDLNKPNVDWNEFPVSDVPLYNDEGIVSSRERMPKEFVDFFKDAVFPKQH
jgi:hypothetical protein